MSGPYEWFFEPLVKAADDYWQRGLMLELDCKRPMVIFIGPTRWDRAKRWMKLAFGAWLYCAARSILRSA